jgi:hypothetical protein
MLDPGSFKLAIEIGTTSSHLFGVVDDCLIDRTPAALFDPRLDRFAREGCGWPTGARRLGTQTAVNLSGERYLEVVSGSLRHMRYVPRFAHSSNGGMGPTPLPRSFSWRH